jgi:hypothetical protein
MQFLITAIVAMILLVGVASSCPSVCNCTDTSDGVTVDCMRYLVLKHTYYEHIFIFNYRHCSWGHSCHDSPQSSASSSSFPLYRAVHTFLRLFFYLALIVRELKAINSIFVQNLEHKVSLYYDIYLS